MKWCWTAMRTAQLFSQSLPVVFHRSCGIWASFTASMLPQLVWHSIQWARHRGRIHRNASTASRCSHQGPQRCCVGFCTQASSDGVAQDLKLSTPKERHEISRGPSPTWSHRVPKLVSTAVINISMLQVAKCTAMWMRLSLICICLWLRHYAIDFHS